MSLVIKGVSAGDTDLYNDADFHTSDIDVTYAAGSLNGSPRREDTHRGAIECHGSGEEGAEALRDRVLLCLQMHDELVESLRGLLAEYDAEIDSEWSGTSSHEAMRAKANPARAILAKASQKEGR